MKKLNDIERQDIVNALADGVSGGLLSRKYNVDRSTISTIKKKNSNLIMQRNDKAENIKQQVYYLALTKLKARIEERSKIPILTLVRVLNELNNQIKLDEGKPTAISENIKHYEKLNAKQIESKIRGLLDDYKHIKKIDIKADNKVIIKPTDNPT